VPTDAVVPERYRNGPLDPNAKRARTAGDPTDTPRPRVATGPEVTEK